MTAFKPVTSANLARYLAKAVRGTAHPTNGYDVRQGWHVGTTVDGAVLDVAVNVDGCASEESNFRAVIVEGGSPVAAASPEFLRAARALYRAHVTAGSLTADQAAHVRYEVAAALYALTPDQVAILAGHDCHQGGTR